MANKIIVVTGPQEGVGKTTLAVNVAAAFAQSRRQSVFLLDTDIRCRGGVAQVSGTQVGPSVLDLVSQIANQPASLPMLRGRVPTNRLNIGCIPLASHARDVQNLTADHFKFFLQAFSSLYDIVIDLEMSHPLRAVVLDAADMVIWNVLPNALSLKATLHIMDELQNQKHSFHKFFFVLNQAGTPTAIPTPVVSQALERFQKGISLELIHEPEFNRMVNQGKPAIIERAAHPYSAAVQTALQQLTRFQNNGAWKRTLPIASSGAGDGNGAAAAEVAVKIQSEKLKGLHQFKQRIHRDLIEELNIRKIDLDTKGDPNRERQLRTNVESTVNSIISKEKEITLTREEREQLIQGLVDEALGLGPLEELLADPNITEIMVNRFDQVYIERRGKITLTDKRFIDNNHVIQVIRRIIAPLGRRIDTSVPMVDARLKDGSRVNAIIPPLAVQGPTITIRRFPERALGAKDLVATQSITEAMVRFLEVCVLMKKNIVIAGGTGTGKTTILNMLSSFIPNDERIVTVEDTAELRMQQDHVVRLEARPANIEGQGLVSIRDLVKNCLRMRPDRIVVGECRGGEALDMLQAMNTGHDGSLTTIHANNPRDAFTRLETLCLMAGMDLPVWALREQIRSAVHILVQLTRQQDGSRKVTCITEVIGRDNDTILTQDLFHFVQDGLDAQNKVVGHYEAMGKLPQFYPELKARGLQLDPQFFNAKGPA